MLAALADPAFELVAVLLKVGEKLRVGIDPGLAAAGDLSVARFEQQLEPALRLHALRLPAARRRKRERTNVGGGSGRVVQLRGCVASANRVG